MPYLTYKIQHKCGNDMYSVHGKNEDNAIYLCLALFKMILDSYIMDVFSF